MVALGSPDRASAQSEPAATAPAAPFGTSTQPPAVTHVVRQGDTLELLAAEFYANRQYAVFIMVANRIRHPRPLRPGEKLRIPTAWKYRVTPGDTLPTLAERHLGDARRALFLADFNGLPADVSLSAGLELTIPFHAEHVAADKETLGSIAAAFYGDSKNAELLRGYNFRTSRVLSRGQSLIVPIAHVRIRESKLPAQDPLVVQRDLKTREAVERAREALPRARDAWNDGDYAAMRRFLGEINLEYLPSETAAEVAFLLGSAYIAFGDEDSALVQFGKVVSRRPQFRVRPDQTSPKIRAVWEKAGGKTERPSR